MSDISNLLLSVRCCRLVLNSPCAWLMSGCGPTPVFPIIGHFLAQWVGSPHLKQPSLFGALGCDNLACLAFKAISFASVLPPKHKQTLWYSWRWGSRGLSDRQTGTRVTDRQTTNRSTEQHLELDYSLVYHETVVSSNAALRFSLVRELDESVPKQSNAIYMHIIRRRQSLSSYSNILRSNKSQYLSRRRPMPTIIRAQILHQTKSTLKIHHDFY